MNDEEQRRVIELTLGILRESLNNMVAGRTYNADEHNLCIALVEFADGSNQTLAAYSNDSALQQNFKGAFDVLGLVPNTYKLLKKDLQAGGQGAVPYACDGMAQHHTEPKLLNYLAAAPAIRRRALWQQRQGFSDKHLRRDVSAEDLRFLNGILKEQRRTAYAAAGLMGSEPDIAKVTLASEIDCCETCVRKTIQKFNDRYPHAVISRDRKTLFELGKKPGEPTPWEKLKVAKTP